MLKPALLGLAAQRALRQVEYGEAKLYIPLITIAEAEMVVEKRRIQATRNQFETLLQKVMDSRNFEVGQLNLDIVLRAAQLTQLSDIFDRLIVAEAQVVNAPLLTRDTEITASNLIPIIW